MSSILETFANHAFAAEKVEGGRFGEVPVSDI